MATSPAINTGKTRSVLIILMAFFMLFAAACGGAEAVTVDSASPATQTNNTEASTAEASSPQAAETADTTQVSAPADVAATPASAPAETTAPQAAPVSADCSSIDYPTTAWAQVANISSSDPDSGLNVRNAPGVSGDRITTIPQGYTVYTDFTAGERCALDSNGDVWWYVNIGDDQGWVHTGYLIETTQGWDEGEEIAEHLPGEDREGVEPEGLVYDCVTVPGAFECVEVGWDGPGNFFVQTYPSVDTIIWAQVACLYQGDAMSCQILDHLGERDPGNGFVQAPTEFLQIDCAAGDPSIDPLVAMACAELATRS